MLLNRIPLRVATAAGAAALVASAAVGVAAWADSGVDPSAAATDVSGAGMETPFFVAEDEEASSGEDEREAAEDARDEAAEAGSADAAAEAEESEAEEEEEEDSGGGGGSSAPSGSPRDIARSMLSGYGWGGDQFSCLDSLWQKESNWDPSAQNPSSGAYGIPQALPGDKMASAGSDWQTNPATQIEWGLGYIEDRYGSPCAAWSHSQANNWY